MGSCSLYRWALLLALVLCCVVRCPCFIHSKISRKSMTRLNNNVIRFNPFGPKDNSTYHLNAPNTGNLYVDSRCIDCDACRWMCPTVYGRYAPGMQAFVYRQPESNTEKMKAYSAMYACPTQSIKMRIEDPLAIHAEKRFPVEINKECFPNVHHCGYHAIESHGTTPYIIYRSSGNVMIDCPRFDARLADTIEKEGGISSMILTHRGSLCDHMKWKERFPLMERIIHACDVVNEDAKSIEIQLEGYGVWNPDTDIDIIYTPGHTRGSMCILYRSPVDPVLFSGDHISFSGSRKRLTGWKSKNKGDLSSQLMFMRQLATDSYDFKWILPAHGRMIGFKSMEEKNEAINGAADIFERENPNKGKRDIGFY